MGILPPRRQFTAEGAQWERVYCAPSALWSFRRTTSDPIARWGNWFLSSRNKSSSWELFYRWIQGCWTSKWMWPWMLTQPMNSSSFQMTWGMSSVGTLDRECKHMSRCSATHFLSWSPLASSGCHYWETTWDKAKNGTWESAENVFTNEERSSCLQSLDSGP